MVAAAEEEGSGSAAAAAAADATAATAEKEEAPGSGVLSEGMRRSRCHHIGRPSCRPGCPSRHTR